MREVLEVVLLDKFVSSLPDGLNTYIGEIGSKMSGGQRQRIQLLELSHQNPNLLLFDEATGGLDNETEKRSWLILKIT